jgi:hypothetical protein
MRTTLWPWQLTAAVLSEFTKKVVTICGPSGQGMHGFWTSGVRGHEREGLALFLLSPLCDLGARSSGRVGGGGACTCVRLETL